MWQIDEGKVIALTRGGLQIKRNHGAPGIDGMTVEAVLPWLRENRDELLQSILEGTYKPSPVRRKEIPKPDGSGVRKLGIPTDDKQTGMGLS